MQPWQLRSPERLHFSARPFYSHLRGAHTARFSALSTQDGSLTAAAIAAAIGSPDAAAKTEREATEVHDEQAKTAAKPAAGTGRAAIVHCTRQRVFHPM